MRFAFVLKTLKESSKRRLFIVPYFFTFANAFLGMLAVVRTFDGDLVSASYCIVSAALMDMLDGRLARYLGVTSSLGMELDSLCDAVSFCYAPVIMVHQWALFSQGITGIAAGALYLCCGLLRLARFNVRYGSSACWFQGLPTTIAALCIAMLIISVSPDAIAGYTQLVALLMVCLAGLMISSIKFISGKRMHGTTVFKIAVGLSMLLVWSWLVQWPMLLVLPFGYVLLNLLVYGYEWGCSVIQRLRV